jgi:hypothetical protein
MAAPSEVVVKFVIGAGFQNVTHEQAVSGKHPLTDEAFQQATVVYQSVEIPHGGKWSAHITRTWAAEFITEALKQDEHQNLVDWRITVGSKVNMWHFSASSTSSSTATTKSNRFAATVHFKPW